MRTKRKREMTAEEGLHFIQKLEEVKTPEDARKLHKEMRKYKNGPRLPLLMRYPDFQMQISIVTLVIVILELLYVAITIIF